MLMKERDGDTENERDKEKNLRQAGFKLTTFRSQDILATGVLQLLPT